MVVRMRVLMVVGFMGMLTFYFVLRVECRIKGCKCDFDVVNLDFKDIYLL